MTIVLVLILEYQLPSNVLDVLVVLKSTFKYFEVSKYFHHCKYMHTLSYTVTHKHTHKRSNKQLSFVQTMYKIIYMAAEPSVEKVMYVAVEPEFQESASYV